jgi:hypothetical protein
MVQKENIDVTAVMNLFHKYRYNMKKETPSCIWQTDKLDVAEMLTRGTDFKMTASMREKNLLCVRTHINFVSNHCSETVPDQIC